MTETFRMGINYENTHKLVHTFVLSLTFSSLAFSQAMTFNLTDLLHLGAETSFLSRPIYHQAKQEAILIPLCFSMILFIQLSKD